MADRFCVAEVAILTPGHIDAVLDILRPSVGVVTHIGTDHISEFGSIAAIAREKAKLVERLPRWGTAILNGDDPNVLAMRSRFAGRTITYGTGQEAMLRATSVRSSWPDRLSFEVQWQGEVIAVHTQLCGAHWTHVVLASLATAVGLGIPLADAAAAVATVEPFEGRMSPVEINGITFIRDDWKAPLWTIEPTFDFMRRARAARKVIVMGTVSDYPGDSSRRYAQIARQALAVADCAIFVGPWAAAGLRAKRDPNDSIRAFASARDAWNHLSRFLTPGDLVLLKGSTRTDHLERLVLASSRELKCWRSACGRAYFCNQCPAFDSPCEPDALTASLRIDEPATDAGPNPSAKPDIVVVGLGNPGDEYLDTPHNAGRAVVDRLAQRLGGEWSAVGQRALALHARLEGCTVCLLKLTAPMNEAGMALRDVARDIRIVNERCILVHDDLHLPLGTVRVRMHGSAGGHRGVQSILQAFQDDRFPRVKVGIGRPPPGTPVLDYVLSAFKAQERPRIEAATQEAALRVEKLAREAAASPPAQAHSAREGA
jgi:aminoacyl-tRNA hydrolase